MRSAGRLKLGYYPLPPSEARGLRRLITADAPFSVLDPCAGTGAALHLLTEELDCRRYGVELDAERAAAAAASGIATVQGNVFEANSKVESFSLLYLNPPYDSETGSLANRRMEHLMLEHTHRWLVVGGLLVFVIPNRQITQCQGLLAAQFTDFRIFRLTDPESVRYDQIVLTAVRKPMRGGLYEPNRSRLMRAIYHEPHLDLAGEYAPFHLPATGPAALTYRGLPHDEIEDLIPQSAVWKQIAPMLLPKEEMTSGRPITPLHGGHVGLLCTAGLLNGVFGSGADRHIARWRSIKTTTEIHEQDEDTAITRKLERFSNELALMYEDGRRLLLTESPKQTPEKEENGDEERTSADRAA